MKKRVLVVTTHPVAPPWDSADKAIAASLIRSLDDYEFVYFTRRGRRIDDGTHRAVTVASRSGKPTGAALGQATVGALLLQARVDLVHVVVTPGRRYSQLIHALRFASLGRRTPIIQTVPGLSEGARFVLRDPAAVSVALDEATAAQLRELGAGRTVVIPPPIDLGRWSLQALPSKQPSLLFAGHLDEDAGAEAAVRIAAATRIDGAQPRLVAAVRLRRRDEESRVARLHALAQSVALRQLEVREEVADMPALVAAADAVIFPATRLHGKAAIPLIILEAVASGRPAIVGRAVPVPDELSAHVIAADELDVSASAAAIAAAVAEVRQSRSKTLRAREVVTEMYGELAVAGRYAKLYEEVL